MTAPADPTPTVDHHGIDVLVRIRVSSRPDAVKVATLQIITPDGDGVEILGMAPLDDASVDAAWTRFRTRADAWKPERPPRDFLKFDLFGQSRIPQRVVDLRPTGVSATAIRMGGLSIVDVGRVLGEAP